MNVEELINKLKVFPPHYEVEVLKECEHKDDLVADIIGVSNVQPLKIVSLEIDVLLP
jgi:hypothetical protein